MKITLFILIILLLVSCDPTYYYEFVVVNSTSHSVKIEGFSNRSIDTIQIDSLNPIETIDINPYSRFSVLKQKGFHPEPNDIFQSYDIYAVNIIFNNEKITSQFCENNYLRTCNIERNILAFDTEYHKEKIGRSQGNNEYRFTYTITEEDYNNAVPIDE